MASLQTVAGIIPACVTPFHADGALDLDALDRLLAWQIEAGVAGLFVTGTSGEFWALSADEKESVWRRAVATAAGRAPVFAGTCANSTREAVDLARRAEACGVDAVTVLTPMAVNLSQAELAAHFGAVAAAVDVAVLLYSNPRLTGMTIAPETAGRVADAHANVRGIKDSSGALESVRAFVEGAPDGFAVLNGYDAGILPALAAGASGAVAASANAIPGLCVDLYRRFRRGDRPGAAAVQERVAAFRRAWSLGTPPSVIKAGAALAGIEVGPPRAPVQPLDDGAVGRLADVMRAIGADVAGSEPI